MTDSLQPTSGSLEAVVIRRCRAHNNQCNLDCPERKRLDLGEIATFTARPQLSVVDPGEPDRRNLFLQWLDKNILGKGG